MALRVSRTQKFTALSAAIGLSLVLGACGGDSDTAGSGGGGSTNAGGIDCSAYTKFGDLKGKTVTVFTSITAPEDQAQIDSYKPFEECTGVEVKYEGSAEFEAQLKVRTAGNNAPDIAFFPQPGLLANQVATGKVKEAPPEVAANVDKYWAKDWKAYGTVDGKFYAAPLGANVKSYVWYSPSAFSEKGYEVPQTWQEMITLSDKIAADNAANKDTKPWCDGIGSDAATGWKVTDWVEDVLLRTAGPEVYDQWVKHEIPFNDPQIAEAMDQVGKILKDPKYVNGGLGDVKSIASTSFKEAGLPIQDGTCFMHRQASFYAANWPKGTKIASDGEVWAFYLPPVDPAKGKPVLGGGEFVGAYADRPEVKAFQTYLSSAEWANAKAKATPDGGWVSANNGLDVNNLTSPLDKQSAKILQDPKSVFRFDGSDLMPAAVGAGSFWKQSTDWITGKSTKDALDAIEKSWPKS
ncbi:MAG: ABC transporter substrate-binding protein [Angustibacter sp.]